MPIIILAVKYTTNHMKSIICHGLNLFLGVLSQCEQMAEGGRKIFFAKSQYHVGWKQVRFGRKEDHRVQNGKGTS